MRAEIAEQPARWRALAQAWPVDVASAVIAASEQVVLAARGTSDHAAAYGQYLLQAVLGIPAYLATPSVTTVFGRDTFRPTTTLVALSQSGRSPDLVATVESARRAGSPTVAITNDPESPLARAADVHVPVLAGAEQAVAATKSYTAELLALHLLVGSAASTSRAAMLIGVTSLARAAEEVLASAHPVVVGIADELRDADAAMVIGRGYGLATAREAALKLTETCALSASGWSAADAKHGPLGQVRPGMPVFLLLGARAGRESVEALVPDLLTRGARVWTVGGDAEVPGTVGTLPLPTVEDALTPMLEILPFQQLSLELALRRGLDPDRPAGLSKVTLTR